MKSIQEWRRLNEFGEGEGQEKMTAQEADEMDRREGAYDANLSAQLDRYLGYLVDQIQKSGLGQSKQNNKKAFVAQEVLSALGFNASKLTTVVNKIKQGMRTQPAANKGGAWT